MTWRKAAAAAAQMIEPIRRSEHSVLNWPRTRSLTVLSPTLATLQWSVASFPSATTTRVRVLLMKTGGLRRSISP